MINQVAGLTFWSEVKNGEEGLTPIYRIRSVYVICRFIVKRIFKINRICGDAAFYEVILIVLYTYHLLKWVCLHF